MRKKELVIVESPAKAKTISRILGSKFEIMASLGHIRDLPQSKLGVDIENDFAPHYVVPSKKRSVVKAIKETAQKASAVYLATDPDREGEAISWHLVEAADLSEKPVHRVVFHEITEDAVQEAFRHPRSIDMKLVNAQQARRILDRLVGYQISPLLWKKVKRGLSAGRVQSVAVRMVVDREREIQGFVSVEYWTIEAELTKKPPALEHIFRAELVGLAGKDEKLSIHNQEEATRLVSLLEKAGYAVLSVKRKQVPRQPAPPFITSTLQQEAWRKLRFSAKRTMEIAQQLYEGLPIGIEGNVGLITYMRTDSTRVAPSAVQEARSYIATKFGADFLPPSPRAFTRKVKGAQEAHEAIRPTSIMREPVALKPHLNRDQFRLYELIWKRMVASQMAAAVMDTTTVDISAEVDKPRSEYLFRATASVVKFPGFLVLYSEGKDEDSQEKEEHQLPKLAKSDPLKLIQLSPEQHFTQPPPRYTEATLIKALEENGIGRPSTYAPTISTIQERGYVKKVNGRLHPQEIGFIVNDLLVEHFADIVDIGFTARMEQDLDEIAGGQKQWVPVLKAFYEPFGKMLAEAASNMPRVKPADEPAGENCPQCGKPMVIKEGRYGRFIACTGYPQCRTTKRLVVKIGVRCPKCGGDIIEKRTKGKRRLFYGCASFPACDFAVWERPLVEPCPECGGLLIHSGKSKAKCTKCGITGDAEELAKGKLAQAVS